MKRFLACSVAAAVYAAEVPINTGFAPVYLDGEGWIAYNGVSSIVIGASVPGDLLTDLEAAGVIGDPIYEQNFLPPVGSTPGPGAPMGQPIWDNQTWSYNKTFDLPFDPSAASWSDVQVVFDGVKMAATVTLNGVLLGSTADMFYRYTFSAASVLKQTGNVLTLAFPISSDTTNNEGRWDSCSGGWDWAFYTTTSNPTNDRMTTFSKGLWRSVYILPMPTQGASLTNMAPLIFFNGSYPTTPMADGQNGPWTVQVKAFMTGLVPAPWCQPHLHCRLATARFPSTCPVLMWASGGRTAWEHTPCTTRL